MLIPYSTDAPIYYLPYATVGMIVLNVLVFLGVISSEGAMSEENYEHLLQELCLTYGHGLRPWQWVTSNFMHGGVMHLLGNMFCLWGFGLVAEGKIGWWRFLIVFFGIGIAECAVEQTFMLFADEGLSFGASSIVYGLLAVCMVWAPQNEMSCVLILFRIFVFDVTIYALAGVALAIEVVTGAFSGLQVSSQVLHLMGAGVGFATGIVMLKKGWVDCEGWDLFSVWQGREHEAKEEDDSAAQALLREAQAKRLASLDGANASGSESPLRSPTMSSLPQNFNSMTPSALPAGLPTNTPLFPDPPPEDPILTEMRSEIADGSPQRAFEHYLRFASDPLNWPLPERDLLQIIAMFQKQQLWTQSVPAMVEYLRSFTARASQVRLKLGHILLEASKRPAQSLQVLSKLDDRELSEKDRAMLTKLRDRAEQMSQRDPNEAVEDW